MSAISEKDENLTASPETPLSFRKSNTGPSEPEIGSRIEMQDQNFISAINVGAGANEIDEKWV